MYFKKLLLQKAYAHGQALLIGASIAAVVHELYASNKNTKQLIMQLRFPTCGQL